MTRIAGSHAHSRPAGWPGHAPGAGQHGRSVDPDHHQPENQALAMDLFKYLADDEFMDEYMNAAIYGPAMQSQVDFPIFSESQVHIGLQDGASMAPCRFPGCG